VAKKQFNEGKRRKIPAFIPFALADNGELAPAALEFQEYLVDCFRRKCSKDGPRDDGQTISQLITDYRHRLKLSVQFALASGVGAMITAAGQPWKP